MVQGTKGIHALVTFISVMVVLWVTWTFTSSLLDFPTDTVQKYLFWGSFIVTSLVAMIGVPYLIAMRDDSTASITSAFLGIGVWGFMIIVNLLLFPFFNAMVNIFSDIQIGYQTMTNASGDTIQVAVPSFLFDTLQSGGFIIQIFSILFLLLVITTLYILPLLVAINPGIFKDGVKNLRGFN